MFAPYLRFFGRVIKMSRKNPVNLALILLATVAIVAILVLGTAVTQAGR
ncbi:MAG TPA: hypothetical protein VF710_09790 [Longimicrobium sp.]|jgi:hypothetical protein